MRLTSRLCRYWRLDFDEVTPIEIQQMVYIYNQLAEGRPISDTLYEITILKANIKTRSKRRKLSILYWQIKQAKMADCGRYDLSTLKPPTPPFKQTYY